MTKVAKAVESDAFEKNCPINEQTGDGDVVGRCWMYMADGFTCPRHGDVSAAVARYKSTKELTLENLRQVQREQKKGNGT
jgi:hypothetical protein